MEGGVWSRDMEGDEEVEVGEVGGKAESSGVHGRVPNEHRCTQVCV